MISTRPVIATAVAVFLALLFFSIGSWTTQRTMARQIAANETQIAALHDEMVQSILQRRQERTARATGTAGLLSEPASQAALVDEIKRELQSEMGLLPVRLSRQRRDSFVEVKTYDAAGESSYSTAGYLGDGYFITVKHGVVDLPDREERRGQITSVKINYRGKELPVRVVDSGNADAEVHPGDWAIVKVRGKVDLPPLTVDTSFPYQFADPIVRLGNDYSKGIILSTGYIGERTPNGLVTCLTDGHPGVSGGGVLDQEGNLVGIPIGRMVGDYRFSFLLPLRAEMFRKVPHVLRASNKSQPQEKTSSATSASADKVTNTTNLRTLEP